jgi:hypothetical protein
MSDGHSRMMWSHTASVMALLANCNRDSKKRPRAFKPADFSPYGKSSDDAIEITSKNVDVMKRAFTGANGSNPKEQ